MEQLLDDVGLKVKDENVLSKLNTFLSIYDIDNQNFADMILAFVTLNSPDCDELSFKDLVILEKEKLSKLPLRININEQKENLEILPKESLIKEKTDQILSENMILELNIDTSTDVFNVYESNVSKNNKNIMDLDDNKSEDEDFLLDVSQSVSSQVLTESFEKRKYKNESLVTYVIPVNEKDELMRLKNESHLLLLGCNDQNCFYMFQRSLIESRYIEKYVISCIHQLIMDNKLSNDVLNARCNVSFQDDACVGGMITSFDKMTNVKLENFKTLTSHSLDFDSIGLFDIHNNLILLDFNEYLSKESTKEISLISGLPVIVKGSNPTGQKMVVSDIFQKHLNIEHPLQHVPLPTDMIFAMGPYTAKSTISDVEPLRALLTQVKDRGVKSLVLCGPFVSASDCDKCQSFSMLFRNRINVIAEWCHHFGTSVIIIPSLTDVSHDFVYPLPPYRNHWSKMKKISKFYENVSFYPEPCIFQMGNVTIGVTTTDVLMHLSGNEISNSTATRMNRICSHILSSKSLYPIYPPSSDMPLDLTISRFPRDELSSHFLFTEDQFPNILFMPSQLRPFIKNINGTVCINPSYLVKNGIRNGCFAYIHGGVNVELLRI